MHELKALYMVIDIAMGSWGTKEKRKTAEELDRDH